MFSVNEAELSILLVEPSSTQLKIIMRQLQQAGVNKIDGVESGAEALDIIQKYPPDLVISAMYLPDMTAADLLLQIRNDEQHQNCNFMLISSETDFNTLEPLRQAGVVAILPKPFAPVDLQRALRTTLDFLDPQELTLESYDAANLRVLLVDDSLTARNHIGRVLQDLGIGYVAKAESGDAAINLLQEDDFDLVITDLNMPGMDGQALTQYIRNELGNSFIPVLMVTSEQNETRLGQVQQAGISALLDKPFEPQSIRETLHRVLDESI
ncbi:response regulator [Methylophaga sp. OBS3]|uniref:response regulator n=1 Tax=Methylophaga sp. OBS3 TaxID=2991934 RepID=UPI00224D9911|nr:response regulator [Methylophaga sp. OBS3]MCX4189730.1 response regulator [Methylophaga sp. OBS3]